MLRIWKDEHGQSKGIGEEQGHEVGDVEARGNRRSMAKPFKSEAHKFGVSLASKQIKVKASMPHKAKMPKENEEKAGVGTDELPCIINKLSIVVDINKKPSYGWTDSILILGNDEVSSKANEAKNVETLMKNMDDALVMNMDEALAKNMDEPLAQRGVCSKRNKKEQRQVQLLHGNPSFYVRKKGLPYLAAALKESIPNKDEIDVDEPAMNDMCNKAKKVMIENAFINLCVAVRYMEVTPFAEMDEEFFHLHKDAIDDAKNINFEVGATWVGKGKPWKGSPPRKIQHGHHSNQVPNL
ncbi:hypothetical protein SLEP1_g15112 [Rubroshorea leprosula]|uniref:Uncharacterized protein n=1 Tax=Rubroshorea leprosula TaxID=152421 RepID=A0AAV5IV84_9ROSI|nr:hypothetical protein SLEP1_g15112 [Rubroshorea leprosula]